MTGHTFGEKQPGRTVGMSQLENDDDVEARSNAETVHILDLPSGHALHELVAPESGIANEISGVAWGSYAKSTLMNIRTGRFAVFSIRQGGQCAFLILVDKATSSTSAVISPVDAGVPNPGFLGRTLISRGISIDQVLYSFAALKDRDDQIHFIDDAPDRIEFSSDCYVHCSDKVILPKVIIGDGDFVLTDSEIARNSVRVNLGGTLGFRNVTGLVLPAQLNVGGDLSLQMSDAIRLPLRFSVGRDLDIALTRIKEFPENFHVGRNIIANGASISRLRGGMVVRGDFDLRECPISEIPWGLEVGGSLNLSGTKVRAMPGDIVIGGNLMIDEHVAVPSTVRIGGTLFHTRPYGYDAVRRFSN